MTSAGQRHDWLASEPVLAAVKIGRNGPARPRTRPGRVRADKACSSKATRAHLRRRKIKATIPEPAGQIASRARRGSRGGRPPAFDRQACKQRNAVERAIGKLRLMRAVATRYDKRDFAHRGASTSPLSGSGFATLPSVIHGTPPSRAGRPAAQLMSAAGACHNRSE